MKVIRDMKTAMVKKLRMVMSNITVEPVVALYCLITALNTIPAEELYLRKACIVNLNYSINTCDDIYQYEDVQIETQQLVSDLQVTTVFIVRINIKRYSLGNAAYFSDCTSLINN